MKKLINLFVLFVFVGTNVYCFDEDMPELLPVSPNAASLGMYGNIPVGYYSGTANVSIPVYEIDLDGLKIPINLFYGNSGIKVSQEASWVGLGWTLNAGGCIIREVRDKDDLGISDGLGFIYDERPLFPWNANNDPDTPIGTDGEYQDLPQIETMRESDSQPDMFYYNFASYSGSLFFHKEKTRVATGQPVTPVIQNQKDCLKIAFYNRLPGGDWIIVDDSGFTYYFGTMESSQSQTYSSVNYESKYLSEGWLDIYGNKSKSPVTTAWMLDSIVSPQGNKVRFYYEKELITTQPVFSELVALGIPYFTLSGYIVDSAADVHEYSYSRSFMEQNRLSRIEFENGSLIFKASGRLDIKNTKSDRQSKKLDRIEIRDKQGSLIKDYILEYVYSGNTDSSNTCRLKLSSFSEKIKEGKYARYSFTYDERTLPAKDSNKTDIWGYYNGKGIDGSADYKMSPPFSITNSLRTDIHIVTGKDLYPDESHVGAEMLKTITSPTGCVNEIVYEPNEFSNAICFSLKGGVSTSLVYTRQNITSDYGTDQVSHSFVLKKPGYIRFYYRFSPNGMVRDRFPARLSLQLEKKLPYSDSFAQYGETIERDGFLATSGMTPENLIPMSMFPEGEYRFSVKNDKKWESTDFIDMEYLEFGIESYDIEDYINTGGGVRVKEVITRESGGQVLRKVYTYKDQETSSGILSVIPDQVNTLLYDMNRCARFPDYWAYPKTNEMSCYTSSRANINSLAGSVYYSHVEESLVDANGNSMGKTVYKYVNNMPKKKIPMTGAPLFLHLDNGLLLSKDVYANNNRIKQKVRNTYHVDRSDSVKGAVIYWGGRLGVKYYDLYGERWQLAKSEKTDVTDNYSITNTVDYTYNPMNWKVCAEKTTVSGSGKSVEKRMAYSVDYADGISKGMVQKNMIGIPIEIKTLVEEKYVSAVKNQFKSVGPAYLPGVTYKSNLRVPLASWSDSYYKPEIYFDAYTDKGKVRQVRGNDDSPKTYLWGYNGQYPVAMIIGASYGEVEAALGRELILRVERSAVLSDNDRNEIDGLREKLPQSLVTTCVYDPLNGVKQITDERGISTYYEYVGGRLSKVNDTDHNLVLEHDYHYYDQ